MIAVDIARSLDIYQSDDEFSRENMESPRSTRKVLTLSQRVNVIKRSEKGESAIAIARSLEVGKTQIQGIVRDKQLILKRWHK